MELMLISMVKHNTSKKQNILKNIETDAPVFLLPFSNTDAKYLAKRQLCFCQ